MTPFAFKYLKKEIEGVIYDSEILVTILKIANTERAIVSHIGLADSILHQLEESYLEEKIADWFRTLVFVGAIAENHI